MSIESDKELSYVELVRKITREHDFAFDDVRRLRRQELAFCADLDQYEDDTGNQKSLDRVQPRDQSIFHHWVYKRGVALKRAPIHINCEAVNPEENPETTYGAEMMKHALEYELILDRTRNYNGVRRTYVGGALMARAWGAAVDYDSRTKRLKYRDVDLENISWTPGFKSMHDPDCPEVNEKIRMPLAVARKKFKNDKIMADSAFSAESSAEDHTTTTGIDFADSNAPKVVPSGDQEFATIVQTWFRVDPKSKGTGSEMVDLPLGDRYLHCTECGFKSPPEAENDFPEVIEQSCPECYGDLKRVDGEERDKDEKKLIISAPYTQGLAEPLYEGPWPVPECEIFPYLWLQSYDVPHKAVGPSDVSQNWTVALTKNATMRLIWEQASRSKPYYSMPADKSIVDARGLPFDFTPEAGDVMYRKRQGPPIAGEVDMIQAQPVSIALFQLLDKLEAAYQRNEGTSDVSIAAGETKDIPVGTIESMIETGNVPIDDFVDMIYYADSLFATVVGYYIRATYRDQLIRWHGDNGETMYEKLQGEALPIVDVTISAGPTLDNVREEKLRAYMMLIQTPPQYRRGLARFMRIDASVVQQLEKDDQKFQQEDPEAQQAVQGVRQQKVDAAMAFLPEGGGMGAAASNAAQAGKPQPQGAPRG